jgi:pyridoxamine 5'-phosphate oxidase
VTRPTPPTGHGAAPAGGAQQPADPALATVLAQSWALLAQGCADPAHGCHWPVLATVALDGAADARTVVLRAVDPAARALAVHSDVRAGKLAQLRANPRACLVFHDAAARTQLRASGPVRIHEGDAAAEQAWAALRPQSRALYQGFARFALLQMRVSGLDWLLLDPAGHRRACFRWAAAVEAAWLEP